VSFEILDTVWFGYERGVPAAEIAEVLGLAEKQVARVIADIVRKQRTTAYLRTGALSVESTVSEGG
jgi:NAD+ synthase